MRVLVVGPPQELPPEIDGWLAEQRWPVERTAELSDATEKIDAGAVDAVVVGSSGGSVEMERFARFLDARRIATIVVSEQGAAFGTIAGSFIDRADRDISKHDLCWRLSTLSRFQSQIRRVEHELEHMQKLGKRLNQHFREIDDEMRLAARLQRDFLPRDVDSFGPVRFSTIFRPATWVSGDIYDIQRLDETHVGFYIADAVGHGMAAGLLTMFIKRSMTTKRIRGNSYEILEPGESLRLLNESLSQYTQPNCQFVTGAYCVLNTETLVMRYARGGHPYPILMAADGRVTELKSTGGLMGLFPEMECATNEVQLHPGDRVVLCTDGIESAFEQVTTKTDTGIFSYQKVFEPLVEYSATEMIPRLEEWLDRLAGSLQPADDVTVVAMEIFPDATQKSTA